VMTVPQFAQVKILSSVRSSWLVIPSGMRKSSLPHSLQ
jgi:hypothetical protein